ncbi:hypothetical protein [Sphingomonas melonis]|uniref:hypothetical protein n=1 Tax=Sphingomonas melonis TaxID=152682 RepID=UPI00037EB833|nr:hypothetical protein [Sphingomonas melonis]
MSDADFSGVDLFGDPIRPRHEGRGRPEHVWTLENSNKVLLAFARRCSEKEAATAIGVSVPTFRKHYFAERAQREAAALRFEMVQLARLNESAKNGSVAAEKELGRRLEKAALKQLSDSVIERRQAKRTAPIGKKEAAREAAKEAVKKFRPRAGPSLLN